MQAVGFGSGLDRSCHDERVVAALALHSSTDCLGMALVDARSSIDDAQVECRSLGRALTNELVFSVQDLLPTQRWSQSQGLGCRDRTWRVSPVLV